MSAYLAWAGATGLVLGLLTWLAVRVGERRVAREVAREAELQARLQAERDAAEAARQAAESQRLVLLHEVNHRARNALTVAQSLVRLSQSGDEPRRGHDLNARIAALASAHDLLAVNDWAGAELRDIARRTLSAFASPALRIADAPQPIGAAAVQPISMVLHELATNAAKHGALSARGQVALAWRRGEAELEITWDEAGGPPPAGNPARRGVGTRVIEALVTRQLGGRIIREWREAGLLARIVLPLDHVLPAPPGPAAGFRLDQDL